MGYIAMALGGIIPIALLAAIIERLAFKGREPTQRAEFTVGMALLVTAVIAGFGMADGGGFVWTAGFIYLPGAALVFMWYRKRYSEAWIEDDDKLTEEA